jgi:predicted TIM-barrel fold metal-dependent hydrolase
VRQNIPVLQSRRDFIAASCATLVPAALCGAPAGAAEPIIDIHQHLSYHGRPDRVLVGHQWRLGVTKTILLPAGRPVSNAATLDGKANGLEVGAAGNEACYHFSRSHSGGFAFGANDVPDHGEAAGEIERYVRRGAVLIGEQKFGVECDSLHMQAIYRIAEAHGVPVLLHFQFNRFNLGFERFHRMLDKFPNVRFIGHAQTWWANIDGNHRDQSVLYPKGPVAAGGLTDRYLADYENLYADLSAGSGLNALTRDPSFAQAFVTRHQDRLLFGTDCSDHDGHGAKCQGAQTLAAIRRLSVTRDVERKLLYENARRLFRVE